MTESGKVNSPKAALEEKGPGGGLPPKLDHLEEYWDSPKAQLNAMKTTFRPKESPPSSCGQNRGAVENSPMSLMASLQLGVVPSTAGRWKVRTNDLAVEEVLMERRAAMVDGRLKGRRLFHDDQPEAEDDDLCGDAGWAFTDFVYDSHPGIGRYQDDPNRQQKGGGAGLSPDSSSSSSSFVCDECLKKELMNVGREDTTTATTALWLAKYVNLKKPWSSSSITVSHRGRWRVLMVCIAIGLVIVAGLFIDGYSGHVPVPT